MTRLRMRTTWGWASLAGVVAAAAFLAVSEAVAALVSRGTSPLIAVGSFVIDIVPRPLKEFAISTFGIADKPVLLASLGVAVVIAAAVIGIVETVRPLWGVVLFAIAAALATAAVITRADAGALAGVASIAGGVVGIAMLLLLTRRLRRWKLAAAAAPAATNSSAAASSVHEAPDAAFGDSAPRPASPERRPKSAPSEVQLDRRGFFILTGIVAASAVVVGLGARALNATTASIRQIRDALRLPSPKTTVPIPQGAELDVDGISPLFTPNADFYRVDTALTVPTVDPNTWRLVIDGMVDKRVELSFDDLIALGLDEYVITLTCVSNEVGGDLVGNARWLGVPVRTVLAAAGVQSGADMVLSRSVDGFTASTPLESLTDPGVDAIFAVAMNGEPLPLEHGFPVRMVVPGLYGYVSATKWVEELKVTTFAADTAYWTPRGYSERAPIKFSSRVDTPKIGKPVAAGKVPIAGMAWAQGVGISAVEVSIDNGEWQRATLSSPVNKDAWVQWVLEWDATPGSHYIAVRAINAAGELQIEESAPIAPDGSSGWQRTLVTVS
ncbi:molybdopterin-dependent oxidoreductase [Microbacterium sp. SORGH_AS_0862]|uniref:molybdopterin-dependent oxidoreductase n=1 Tax=Microbacterium sp. SORGH_AS_0862 TaxID=3041789 RepID=UPI00278F2304|nr:molybdopterin-dependent oxidoreductase [Microbacterium sp. SORGH_AS_0862]MDQ1205449.1 DMSO/TMAO reductase YedYZ molybdopterin-dependent catalytic subunit [Microbacterium sp. SORGH_AS_0862]